MGLYTEANEIKVSRDNYKNMLTSIVIDNASTEDIVIFKDWIDKWVAISLYEILYSNDDYIIDIDEYYKVKFVTEFNCMKTENRIFSYGKCDKDK